MRSTPGLTAATQRPNQSLNLLRAHEFSFFSAQRPSTTTTDKPCLVLGIFALRTSGCVYRSVGWGGVRFAYELLLELIEFTYLVGYSTQNAATMRAGRSVVRPSTTEKNARKPPISTGLVFLLLFVVVGGGRLSHFHRNQKGNGGTDFLCVFGFGLVAFELIRYFVPDPPMTHKSGRK